MPKMLKKPHTPNTFTMEETCIYFRSLDFYKIAILVDCEEKIILLNPEQHNLLILLSAKERGYKYHRITSNLFNDLLEMYTFL